MFHKLFILSFTALIFSAQSSFGEMVLSSDSILEVKLSKKVLAETKVEEILARNLLYQVYPNLLKVFRL